MSDYISRELASKRLDNYAKGIDETDTFGAMLRAIISDIPAADVRPVVRCKDCKYNKREVTDFWGNDAIQCITGQTHRHDWFCDDGKRGRKADVCLKFLTRN